MSVSPPPLAPPVRPVRIGPLDTFRCLTVTLALLSHVLLEFRVDTVTSPGLWLAIRSVTRSSTPGLLLLFGVMAEVVHYRRYAARGGALWPRLRRRVVQCYAAFLALAALVTLCRPEPALYLVRSVGLLTLEGYNVIFALYLLLLLGLLAILPVRHRWGFGGLGVLLAGVWALDALVVSRLPAPVDALRVLGDLTLGTAGTWGPSAFHSVTLVLAGMAFGNALYVPAPRRDARTLAVGVVAASALLVGLEMYRVGVGGFFRGIVDLATYRAHNAPVYYAYGVLGMTALLPLATLADRIAPAPVRRTMHALGSRTFSYFFLGNVVLILIPDYTVPSAGLAVLEIAGFLAVSMALTLGWAALSARRQARQAAASTAETGVEEPLRVPG